MATPTLIQDAKYGYSSDISGTMKTTKRRYPLANTVLNGNAVIVCLQCTDAAAPVITDDKGNSYTILINKIDTTNHQSAIIAYRLNVTNSPIYVEVTWSPSMGNISAYVSEWKNIDTVSTNFKSNGNFGNSATPTPGAATPNAANDLILTYVILDSIDPWVGQTANVMTSWTAPTNFTKLASDIWAGDAVAYRLAPDTSSQNPQWGASPSIGWNCVQGVFSNLAQGTDASITPRVISVTHQQLSMATGMSTSPYSFEWPTGKGGNFFYAGYIGTGAAITPNHTIGTLTDSVNGAWTDTGPLFGLDSGSSGAARGYYMKNPTGSPTMTGTLAFTNPAGGTGDNLFLYECIGIDTLVPFDQQVTASGNNAAATSFDAAVISPSKANGLIFTTLASADAVSGTPNCMTAIDHGTFLSSTDPNEEVLSWENDNNNGWAVYRNPDVSTITFRWTCGVAGSRDWRTIADAFIPTSTPAPGGFPILSTPSFPGPRMPGGTVWGLMHRLPNPSPPPIPAIPIPAQAFVGQRRPGGLVWMMMRRLPNPAAPLAVFDPSPMEYVAKFPGMRPGRLIWMLMHGLAQKEPLVITPSVALFRKTLSMIGSAVGKRQAHNTE